MLFTLILSSFVYAQPKVVETRHFHFTVEAPTSATDAFISQADEVFTYVSERMGVPYYKKIEVAIRLMSSEACPVRGMVTVETIDDTEVESMSIIVFTDMTTKLEQLLGVLAHELGHLLHFDGFGEPGKSSGLAEGLASWAAGNYYLTWQRIPSFYIGVKHYLDEERYLPLKNERHLQGIYPEQGSAVDCLNRRDILYTEWASFVTYLIDTYSVDRFKRLLASEEVNSRDKSTRPNFEGVYGESFEVLIKRWLEQVRASG